MTRSWAWSRWLLIGAAALLVVGCGEQSASDGDRATASESPTTASPAPSTPETDVDRAVADLAERLGVEPGEIELVAQEEVTWRDGSLGCAEPGMSYTQALVDGMRITLAAQGREYEYHSGGSAPPKLCEKPTQ